MPNIGSFELLLVCAVVIVILFISAMLANVGFSRQSRNKNSGSALDMLKMRYVRGEITREQFERMKQDLQKI